MGQGKGRMWAQDKLTPSQCVLMCFQLPLPHQEGFKGAKEIELPNCSEMFVFRSFLAWQKDLGGKGMSR